MPYNWTYGVALSGLQFPMVTASGTYAKSYDTAQLSSVISKDGGAWAAATNKCSGIPGDGVYTHSALTAVEMQAYTWAVKITASSGCLDQTLLGINASSYIKYADVSGFAHITDISALAGVLIAISGLNTSNLIAQCSSIIGGVSSPVTLVTGQTTYASGLYPILTAISGLKTDVSALPGTLAAVSGLKSDVSGLQGILTAISGTPQGVWSSPSRTILGGSVGIDVSSVNAVRDINTTNAASLTSGTLAHDIRLIKWTSWENLNIDKTYTPNRMYIFDGTNLSAYYSLTDDANNTIKSRG